MLCPKCGADLEYVIVASECKAKGIVNGYNRITDYEDLPTTSVAILRIECPECGKDITEYIKR